MKIVFYSVSTSLYGAPTSMLNLIQGLLQFQQGIRIYVVVPRRGPLTEELKKMPVTLTVLPFYRWTYKNSLYRKKKGSNAFLAGLWFYKNVWNKILLNLLWLPLHLLRIRKIKPDLVYINSSLSPMGTLVARILRIQSVWHHRETINDPETNFFIEWNAHLALRIFNWPAVHIYPSYFLKDTYSTYVFAGQSYVVYNGVSVPELTPDQSFSETRPVVYGMVGRINSQKGQKEVIECFRDLFSSYGELFIYGAGEKFYVDRLREIVPKASVFFKGFESKDVIYREIDFLIINARNESFGRVVAEAYAYGVPVLALRSGALPEIVDEQKTGFLYQNHKELLSLIQKLKDFRQTPEYSKMQESCRQKVNDNFTIRIHAENIYKILARHSLKANTK